MIVLLGDVGQANENDPQWNDEQLSQYWKKIPRNERPVLLMVQYGNKTPGYERFQLFASNVMRNINQECEKKDDTGMPFSYAQYGRLQDTGEKSPEVLFEQLGNHVIQRILGQHQRVRDLVTQKVKEDVDYHASLLQKMTDEALLKFLSSVPLSRKPAFPKKLEYLERH